MLGDEQWFIPEVVSFNFSSLGQNQKLKENMIQLSLFKYEEDYDDSFFGFKQVGNWYDQFGLYLQQYAKKNYSRIKTLSLFSGAGGLDIGFHDVGFDILSSVEIEKSFASTLLANTGEFNYLGKGTDINCVDIKDFHPNFENVDFIIGGPPCQTFSAAGARAMGVAGTKDARGNLFLEYARLLDFLKPKGFLFENVYRIVGANQGKDWDSITKAFSGLGYKLFYRILDTADYGVPQHRERLIIVGIREDVIKNHSFLFPCPTHGPDSKLNLPHYSSSLALEGLKPEPVKLGLSGKYGDLLKDIPPGLNYSFYTEKMGHPNPIFAWRSKFSDFLYKADPSKPVRTIKAQGGQYTGPFHWDNRIFTLSELKRLQTFPDAYKILGGRGLAIHQIGNSVPPQFARILALSILEQVFGISSPVNLSYLSPSEELSFRKRKREVSDSYRLVANTSIKKNLSVKKSSPIIKRRVAFDVTANFGVSIHNEAKYLAQSYLCEEVWYIDVSLRDRVNDRFVCLFDIEIKPIKAWAVPASKIILRSSVEGLQSFTAVWKILDWLLGNKNIKADLVQLCGYYQYAPSFNSVLNVYQKDCLSGEPMERFLQMVCSNFLVGRSKHVLEFCKNTGFSKQLLKEMLIELKSIGYEVRSSGTNLSFDEESYLIPYAFPTLNPQSVQLHKKL